MINTGIPMHIDQSPEARGGRKIIKEKKIEEEKKKEREKSFSLFIRKRKLHWLHC